MSRVERVRWRWVAAVAVMALALAAAIAWVVYGAMNAVAQGHPERIWQAVAIAVAPAVLTSRGARRLLRRTPPTTQPRTPAGSTEETP